MHDDLEPRTRTIPEALRAELPECFASPAHESGFRNPWDHAPLPGLAGVLRWKARKNEHRPRGYRAAPLPVPSAPLTEFETLEARFATRLFWLGHASFLVAMDGLRVLIDPIFGRAGGIVPRVTPPAAQPEELGEVHAVLVTHGHHDHLDPNSLKRVAEANGGRTVFVVPRGLSKALPRACREVRELSWWEHVTLRGVRVNLVPAQHWHRRGALDTNRGLWGGFVLEGSHRVYHSGDTGYFAGFRAIGRVFGGLDAVCLPLGAYEPKWFMSPQHMSPDESLTAYEELAASHFVGMHWGTFDLSDEPVDAGPQRLRTLVNERELDIARFHVLVPGGSVALMGEPGRAVAHVAHAWAPR